MTAAVGDLAPDFTTRNQHGESVGPAGLLGRRVLLVFYPWAHSNICGGELAQLRADQEFYRSLDVSVLAVSCDAMFTLRAYADAEGFTFDLLTDHWPHGAIARAYGVFDDQAGCALRGTFLIDADGRIVWTEVNGIGETRDLVGLRERVETGTH